MSVTKSAENQMLTDIDDDVIEQFFDDFQNAANVSRIYDFDGQSCINELNLSVHDVISEVTTATRALQKADKVVNRRKPNLSSQNSKFVPISFLHPSPKVPKQATASKFETQYFSNTQLINVVENAEAIYESRKGVTQEFDVEFAPNIPASQCCVYSQDNMIKDSRTPSPILGSKKSSNNSTPRLTVNLDVFEKFENIATSLINSNKFITEEAKVLIHSQILNNELEIHGDCSNNMMDKYDSARNLVQEFETNDVIQKKDDSTTGSFLDDEILFSSDEEEYVQKDLKDLHSTCELNSSTSDNESEILDKTLFVGFITANNRPIQITSESYCKANNIFNETVNEIESNTFDMTADLEKSKDDNVNISPVLNGTKKSYLKIKSESYCSKKEIPKNTQPKTPSNKKVITPNKPLTRKDVTFKMLKKETVSDLMSKDNDIMKSSPAKSKSSVTEQHQIKTEERESKYQEEEEDLFSDDISFNDLGCTQDYKVLSKLKHIKTKSNENLSDEVLAKTKHWFHNIDIANHHKDALKGNVDFTPEGFTAASNKKIDVSDTTLAKARHLLQNIKEDEDIFNDKLNIPTNVDIEMTDATSAKSVEIFEEVDDNDKYYKETLKNFNSNIEGMDTADFLDNDEFNMNEVKESTISNNGMNIVDFKTASNQNVQISEKALAMSKHLFQGIDEVDEKPSHSEKEIVGFKTASNKNVQISEKALAMSKHLFQGIDEVDEKPSYSEKKIVGFKTASNKNVQISEKALAMSKHLFQGIDEVDEKPSYSEKKIVGFKTASNKNVQISEKALAMSKHLFQGIDEVDEKPSYSEKKIVGFKTASNKNVQISEKALAMSKHLFQGIDEVHEKPSHSEKEIVGFKTASNKNVQISEKALAMSKHLFQGIGEVDEKPSRSEKEIVGLKTASNKNVQISQKALTMSKHIFGGIDREEPTNSGDKEIVGFKTASNKNVQISEKALAISKHIFQGIDEVDEKPSYSEKKIVGFKTASNKNVQISEKALAMSKHLFQGIDEVHEKPSHSEKEIVGFKTASNKNVQISEKALAMSKHLFQGIDEVDEKPSRSEKEIVGFKTASNKNVQISEKALAMSKHLFQGIDEVDEKPSYSEKKIVGFKTASNKNVQISEKALAMSKHLFQGIDEVDEKPSYSEKKIVGFKTASNKNVQISEKALAMSKHLFQGIDEVDEKPSYSEKKIVGFKTASNKNVQISEKALAMSKHLFQGIDEVHEKPSHSEKEIVGFKTASNKNVQISEKALAMSKHLFQGIDEVDEKPSRSEKEIVGLKTASNKNVQISQKALTMSKHIFGGIDREEPTNSGDKEIVGFKTASNKNVQISEKALAISKHIFQGIDEVDEKPSYSEKKIVGFKTASNKNVQISEKALAMSKHLFQGIDEVHEKPSHSEKEIVGFKTASNKNVQISEKALAMSKHLFQGIDEVDEKPSHSEKEIVGFKTASNKNVQISEKALAMSKHLFQGIDEVHEKPSHSEKEIVGFKTASNKNVQISEKALAMSKHLFQGIDEVHEKPSHSEKEIVGFKTASNKNVQISEKALAMSKHIFQGIDEVDEKPSRSEKEIVGLKTASNKNVQISQKALTMSKHIFGGIDREEPTNSGDKEIVGFKTASNKNVQISEKALAISKHIFQGIDGDDEKPTHSEKEIVGFKTASNKNVIISEEALAKTKCLFKDIDIIEENSLHGNDIVVGFKTASNKDVQISEEALSKTKHFFKNIDVDEQEPMDCDNNRDNTENNEFVLGNTLDMVDDDAINIDLEHKKINDALVKTMIPKFEGFQTGNNNTIEVSESALVKSKCLLQNLPGPSANISDFKNCEQDYLKNNEEKISHIPLESNFNDINDEAEMSQILKGFSTGNNKSVSVTKEAILKSKHLFKKSSHKNNNENYKKLDNSNDIITNLLDTQLTKDFEHNLYTEDFCKESQNLKRPGSPILHYSKVKRMKLGNEETQDITARFDENYKKHKTITLKDLNDNSNIKTLDPFLLKNNFDNILNIEFEGNRNKLTDDKITMANITKIFKESVNKNIIPEGWLENHAKLILWKLISYEIKFPNKMKGICNVTEMLNQLKYRYDRELYNVERPALRKILEKDESPAKTLILCVVRIFANNVSVSSITNKSDTIELEVTDGWYCLRATIDRILSKLVHQGKITVGIKIVTQGAELVNCDHGVAPWEDTTNVRLKLSANSTRRVRWDTKLGFYRGGITTYLPHVMVGGGRVPKMRVFVSRVYPLLYVERLEDGSTVTRTERQEEIHQIKYESERQLRMEKLYEEVSRERLDAESQGTGEGSMNTGSQIARTMRVAKDPEELRATLTESQLRSLHDYQTKKCDLIAEDLLKEVNDRLNKSDNKRSVVSLLKIRVNGYYMKNVSMKSCGALLSIWRVGEEILETLAEGSWIDLYNAVPTGMRNSELQLSAGHQTLIDVCKSREKKYSGFTKQLRRKAVNIADVVSNPNMKSPYNEFDISGLIFHIEPTTEEFEKQGKTNDFQNVFLTDREMKFVCVNFWGGVRKTGFEKLLAIGQVIAGINLRSRVGNSGKTIPHFRFLETSYFTKSPKYRDLKANMMTIVDKFSEIDVVKFCKDCVSLKNQMSLNKYKRNVSPMLNKSFFDSPLPNFLSDFDLSAADFESTFKQASPSRLKKSVVDEKIEKLRKMYGEPPPLSPICIKNKGTNVTKSYKSPFSITNERSVANIENQQEIEASSPVLIRRSVKRVFNGNPVKLDFCQNENLPRKDSSSPPMSLD